LCGCVFADVEYGGAAWVRPEASEDIGGNPLEGQPGFDGSLGGMTAMQNLMIIGLVCSVVALYVRSRMRADAAAAAADEKYVA
jgi:hypothetical protein